jgi:hypothetical protein
MVASELAANRAPYQQEQGVLGQEQTQALNTNTAAYGKLAGTIKGEQTGQEASAKTFSNYAADALAKAQTAAPGAQESAERLGLKPGEQLPESVRRQQEDARTLLSGIAQSNAAGTTARQQAESAFLANTQVAAGQAGVESGRAIEGQFGRQKASVAGREAALLARGPGTEAKLKQSLFEGQDKERIAAAASNYKGLEAERKGAETTSKIGAASSKAKTEAGRLKNETARTGATVKHYEADEAYKRAGSGDKARKDTLDIQKKELDIKKAIEAANGHGGKPLTRPEIAKFTSELSAAFNVFKRGREAGASPASIRQSLESGGHRYVPSEKEIAAEQKQRGITFSSKELAEKRKGTFLKGATVRNPAFLKAAEDIMQKEYVGADTKAELRGLGLPDSGWSERFLGKKTAPGTPGTQSGLKRGR